LPEDVSLLFTYVYCLIRPSRECPLRRLAKWGCPRSPAATARQTRFRAIGLMLLDRGYAKDVPLLSKRFRRRTGFKLLTPKFTEATEKSVFGEKQPLNGKSSKFRYTKGFMRTLIHVFLSSFAEIGKAELTKRVHCIHHEKG